MNLAVFEGIGSVITGVLLPVGLLLAFFMIFQVFFLKRPMRQVSALLRGLLFAFIGLIFFIQGIDIAFMPIGKYIGEAFAGFQHTWLLIPLGFVLGFLITLAEPQVKILSQMIEEASSGYLRSKVILLILCTAVALFTALAMARTVFGIPICYIIIPGYIIAIILLFFADKDFLAMAFDSGSIATGPLITAFAMSLTIGVANVLDGRSPLIDGFGLIGIITLAPIISIQLLSLIYPIKPSKGGGENDTGKQIVDSDHS
jgi:hypothetical protein